MKKFLSSLLLGAFLLQSTCYAAPTSVSRTTSYTNQIIGEIGRAVRKAFRPDSIPGLVAWYNPLSSTTTSAGAHFQAMQLAAGQYVGATTAAFDPGVGDFTIGFSYYLDSSLTGNHSFYEGGSIGNNTQFIWGFISATQIAFYVGDGDSGYWSGTSSSAAARTTGVWHTLIVKFDRDGNATAKLDGSAITLSGAAMTHGLSCAPGAFYVGGFAAGTSIPGRIDGFFYANRLTTDAEDTWLYNLGTWRQYSECGAAGTDGAALDATVIKGWYDFENSGTSIGNDSTANAANLTRAGTPTQANGVNYKDIVVGSWSDLAGVSSPLTQATDTNKPELIANALNGKSALRFNNSSLTVDFGSAINSNYTIFLVGKKTTPVTVANVALDSLSGAKSIIGSNASGRWVTNSGAEQYSQRSDTSAYHIWSMTRSGTRLVTGVDGYEKTNIDVNDMDTSTLNGGFESAGAGGADIWLDWSESAGTGALADETTLFYSGAHAAKVTGGAASDTLIYKYFPTTEFTRYKVTFKTRGDGGANPGRYAVYDGNHSAYLTANTSTGNSGTTYSTVTFYFTTVAGGTNTGIFLRCPAADGSIAYYDECTIVKDPSINGLTVGKNSAGTVSWVGDIVEVIVYNRALAVNERDALRKYLAKNYALTLGKLIAWYDGTSQIWIRTPFDATKDLLHVADINFSKPYVAGSAYEEKLVQMDTATFASGRVIAATVADGLATAGALQEAMSDDICPINVNGTYIMGNHGAAYGLLLTVSSHDKTVADIGSRWVSDAGYYHTLMAVNYNNDATHLLFVSDNSSGTTPKAWSFRTVIDGAKLTHVSGATHTAQVDFTGYATVQVYPAIRNTLRQIYLNGSTIPTTSGTYLCDFVDVRHVYEGIDFNELVDFIKTKAGSVSAPAFDDPAIPSFCKRDILYRFQPNGVTSVKETLTVLRSIYSLGYMGFIQGNAPTNQSGGTTKLYVPRVSAFDISGTHYDPTAIQDITTLANQLDMNSSRWADANKPPDRVLEYTLTSGAVKYSAKQIGYFPELLGAYDNLKVDTNIATHGPVQVYTTLKMYPSAATLGSTTFPLGLAAGTELKVSAFRSFKSTDQLGTATDIVIAKSIESKDYYVWFDYHTNFSGNIVLPPYLTGKLITVVDKSADVTVSSTMVGETGIAVTVTNNYGYGVLRLS